MYPRQTVTTPYGDVTVALTSGTHAHVSTEDGTRLSYRGRDYYVSAHFYVSEETGEWSEPAAGDNAPAYVTRDYEKIGPYKAPTIYRAIVAECLAAVIAVTSDDSLLVTAETMERERDVERAQDTYNTARAALEAAEGVLIEAQSRLEDHVRLTTRIEA